MVMAFKLAVVVDYRRMLRHRSDGWSVNYAELVNLINTIILMLISNMGAVDGDDDSLSNPTLVGHSMRKFKIGLNLFGWKQQRDLEARYQAPGYPVYHENRK